MKEDKNKIIAKTLNDAEQVAIRRIAVSELGDFVYFFLHSMIFELRNLPPSKQYELNKFLKTSKENTPLRQLLIKEFQQQLSSFDRDELKNKYLSWKDGKATITIKLDKEIGEKLLWISDGTGIYNETEGAPKTPIVPVEKDYMFIPRARFSKGFYFRKYGDKYKPLTTKKR